MRTQTRIRCLMAFCCSIVVVWPLAPAFAQAVGGETAKTGITESTANYDYPEEVSDATKSAGIGRAAFGFRRSTRHSEGVSDATESANMATGVSIGQSWDASKVKLMEDLDIMARLIDKTLSKELGGDYHAETFLSEGCERFYVPGMGAIFILRVAFPVRLGEIHGVEVTPMDELDPWEQERVRLQTGTTISHGVAVTPVLRRGNPDVLSVKEFEEFEKRISVLKRNLISILGTYGKRISGLSAQDRIAFVVFGGEGGTQIRTGFGSAGMPGDGYGESRADVERMRADVEKIRQESEKIRQESMAVVNMMPWIYGGGGDSDTTLVFSALVSELPEKPPAEMTESAHWVEVTAY